MANDDAPLDPKSLKLDSSSIRAATPYLLTLSQEQREALLPEAHRQESLRLQEQHSHDPFYSRMTKADWDAWADGYCPKVLMPPLVVPDHPSTHDKT